jgi:chromosome segregation ATPase
VRQAESKYGGFVCTAATSEDDMSEIDNRLDELEDEIEALQLVIKRAQDELARLDAEHHRLCAELRPLVLFTVGEAGGNRDR